jgi:hypothetical protein
MKRGISLYKLITDEFRNLMSVNTVDMMNIISHQIEDVIMDNNGSLRNPVVNRRPKEFSLGNGQIQVDQRQSV